MALITNTTRRTPIGLAGVLVGPGQSVEVEGWDKIKGRKNVKAMLEAGDLQVGKAAADKVAKASKTPETPEPPAPPAGGSGDANTPPAA